ncbi:MAG TPA: TIGR02186 family protein [Hyphomicrobiaceae bacterium]|nr:TIGR02186 family protein [Hyphomicrobiaceae bacterium]
MIADTTFPRPTVMAATLAFAVLLIMAVPLISSRAQVGPTPAGQVTAPTANKPPAPASDGRPAESVEADVSTRAVAVTSSFTGTEIIVFGTVEHSRQPTPESGYYDVAVIVDGTPTPIIARRKSNVAGIWINAESLRFEKVPSYYAIASTRPIEEVAEPQILDQNRIGFDSIHMKVAEQQSQMAPANLAEFRRAVIRLKQKEQLYQKSDYGVAFIGRSLFRSTISLPANVPVGPLITHTYLFRDGKLLSKHTNNVVLRREGLERYLHSFAFDYPLLYGIFAVLTAVAAGLIASTLFKRGSH